MPSLPAGWIAKFDQVQNSSYFINVHTGASQRRLPKAPASSQFAQDAELAARLQAEEQAHRRPGQYRSHNHSIESDAALAARLQNGFSMESDATMAARLQAEEDARAPHRRQRPQQQGQNNVPQPSGGRPGKAAGGVVYGRPSALGSAMSIGSRPKNRTPKKVRWGTPLAVLVQ